MFYYEAMVTFKSWDRKLIHQVKQTSLKTWQLSKMSTNNMMLTASQKLPVYNDVTEDNYGLLLACSGMVQPIPE